MSDELTARLAQLRNYKMTPEEVFEQRVSFVYSGQADGPHAKSKDEIRAMLTESYGRPRPAWQPIETAPRDGRPILVWPFAQGLAYVAVWNPNGGDWCEAAGEEYYRSSAPTHWQPLPEPPDS